MQTPDIEDLIQRLQRAKASGVELSVEQVCRDAPGLFDAVRRRWESMRHWDQHPHANTQPESTEEVERKLAAMPENVVGTRLVMQTELHLEEFHDCGGLGEVYQADR